MEDGLGRAEEGRCWRRRAGREWRESGRSSDGRSGR